MSNVALSIPFRPAVSLSSDNTTSPGFKELIRSNCFFETEAPKIATLEYPCWYNHMQSKAPSTINNLSVSIIWFIPNSVWDLENPLENIYLGIAWNLL